MVGKGSSLMAVSVVMPRMVTAGDDVGVNRG